MGVSLIMNLIKRAAVFSVLIFSLILYPNLSQASFWSDPLGSIRGTVADIVNQASGVLSKVADVLGLSHCDTGYVDGVEAYCFDSQQRAKMNAAIDVLATSPYSFQHAGVFKHPYTETRNRTSKFVNFDSESARHTNPAGYLAGCSNDNSNWGCHFAGVTFISSGGNALERMRLSGLLLHESEHSTGKMHSCGSTADKDLAGPYGMEALYQMSQTRNLNSITAGERSLALSRAAGIANYQLCQNGAGRDSVFMDIKNSPVISTVINRVPASRSGGSVRSGRINRQSQK